jgi:hypothetical protein
MQRLRSMIFPVVIGDGKRLFAGIGMLHSSWLS